MTADFFQLIGSLFRIPKRVIQVIPWRDPNKEKLDSQILQAMQVGGAPTKRN